MSSWIGLVCVVLGAGAVVAGSPGRLERARVQYGAAAAPVGSYQGDTGAENVPGVLVLRLEGGTPDCLDRVSPAARRRPAPPSPTSSP